MIQVRVSHLSLSKMGFVLLLKGTADPRTLPIFIGAAEAQSIALQMSGTAVPRPITHDLFKNLLDCLECRLKRVDIHSLQESTFFARLLLEHDGLEFTLDARPSDAVALALRCDSPIYVALSVMTQAGIQIDDKTGKVVSTDPAAPHHPPVRSPLTALQAQLTQAVAEEHYEEAARIRDEIRRLDHPHSGN
jgi:bifunctional DNase/RNase